MKQQKPIALLLVMTVLLAFSGCGGGGYSSSGGSSGSSSGGGVSTITVSPTSSAIAVGATQQFMATATNSSGATVTGVTYSWTSSNTNVATVDAHGLATAVAAGTCKITASYHYSISGVSYTINSNQATLMVSTSGMVAGVAAVGHPFINALITLKDSRGQIQYTMTDRHGHFSVMTGGLTFPFLLKATDDQNHVMYSIATGEGTVNIDPLSDLMTRLLYQSKDTSVETAFAGPGVASNLRSGSLSVLDHALVNFLAAPLASHGLDSSISLLNTPFIADGTGLDGLLDQTTISYLGNQFIVTNPDTTLVITLQTSPHAVSIQAADNRSRILRTKTIQLD